MLKLISEARMAWRFASVQAALVLALLSAVQAEVLPLMQPIFSPEVWPWVSGALALAVVLLRVMRQPSLEHARQAAFERELAETQKEVGQVLAWGREVKAREGKAPAPEEHS